MTCHTSNYISTDILTQYFLPGIIAFLISFVVYTQTLLPSVGYSGDTAKFQFIGKILGIPHAPGYPLYVILNYFFSKLPVGNLAYRINLMSAFFAALTITIVFLVIQRIVYHPVIAVLTALVLAFSQTFWSQAVVAEVYTLHACLLSLVIFLLLVWAQKQKPVYFYFACFMYAISFGNHLLMVTVLPAFVGVVLLTDYKILLSKKTISLLSLFVVISMLQYSYILIRSSQNVLFSDSIGNILDFITGRPFHARMFVFSLKEIMTERIPMFVNLLQDNFSIGGIIAGCFGMYAMLKKQFNIAVFLILLLIGNLAYSLNYNIDDIFVYFIPTYLVFSICIGYCIKTLWALRPDSLKLQDFTRIYRVLLITGLALFCWKLVEANYPVVDQSHNTYVDFFTNTVLEHLEERSIILLPQQPRSVNYEWTMYYLYKRLGEEKRQGTSTPLPHYFFPFPDRRTFPYAPWTPHNLKRYLKEAIPVYVQGDRGSLINQGYLLQEVIFYRGENIIEFLQGLREQSLLIVSMKYEGTNALDHSMSKMMAAFGLHHNLLDKPFYSYAAVGVKESGHFSGVETLDLGKITLALKKGDKIGTSGVFSPVDIEITSHGSNMTELNEIRLNGENYSLNSQGMNIVVIDPKNGDLLHRISFNTNVSLYRNEVKLWKVIGEIRDKQVVLFAPDEKTHQFWNLEDDTIDLTNRNHRKYLLQGWLPTKRWGTPAKAPSELIFSLNEKEDKLLSLDFIPESSSSLSQKKTGELRVYMNGVFMDSITIPPEKSEQIFLASSHLQEGLNLLSLQYPSLKPDRKIPQDNFFVGIKKITITPYRLNH